MSSKRIQTQRIQELVARKAKLLRSFGIESAEAEVEWILCYVTGFDRLHLYLHGSDFLNRERLARVDDIIEKRLSRYPLQYILGESWFYGRRFLVNPSVMVPTPETERLVEQALAFIKARKLHAPRVLDVGVGSGVIAVTIAAECARAKVCALDISNEALEVARENAAAIRADKRVQFQQSDLFDNLDGGKQFDLILSNPPYIAEADYPGLMPEVHADPKLSLLAGKEGMDIIERIVKEGPGLLSEGGRLMFEIGYGQSEKVAELTARDARYRSIDIIKDFNDIDRIVILGCHG